MKTSNRRAYFSLAWIGILTVSFLTLNPLFAQDIAASAATAEGFEGLQYNPAAVDAGRSLSAAFVGACGAADQYSTRTWASPASSRSRARR